MTSRQTITGFLCVGLLLGALFVSSLFLDVAGRDILLKEGGIVELLSVVGYVLCAGVMIGQGRVVFCRKHHYFLMLMIFFMLRELDFDKRFTTMGIFKIKLYLSHTVHWGEKLVAALIILVLLYVGIVIVYRHFKGFWSGLKDGSVISLGVLITGVLLVVSKSVDGLQRKLMGMGVRVQDDVAMHVDAVEEILELGIPLTILVTLVYYFRKVKVS